MPLATTLSYSNREVHSLLCRDVPANSASRETCRSRLGGFHDLVTVTTFCSVEVDGGGVAIEDEELRDQMRLLTLGEPEYIGLLRAKKAQYPLLVVDGFSLVVDLVGRNAWSIVCHCSAPSYDVAGGLGRRTNSPLQFGHVWSISSVQSEHHVHSYTQM